MAHDVNAAARSSRFAPAPRSATGSWSSSPSAATRSSRARASCPPGDQTLLFTNSGMVQFKDALTGVEKRDYVRAVDYQRCLRVAGKHNDFEEVGRTPRHHTLFEMLGNWSFGDYFKREAIHWAWEFLTRDLGIPADRLAATVYTTDDLAHSVWKDEIGLPPERLVRWGDFPAGDEKNWWRMGDVGPCGPCSELHYDRGAHLAEGPECVPDHSEHCPRWLEVWNLVFMEFELHPDRIADAAPGPRRRHGHGPRAGRERRPGRHQQLRHGPVRADPRPDARAAGPRPRGFEAGAVQLPGHRRPLARGDVPRRGRRPARNEGRGYVLRRIMRRAIRHGRLLGRHEPFLGETAKVVIDTMAGAYPHLAERRMEILGTIEREERQFNRTLEAGVGLLEEALIPLTDAERVIGRSADALPADAPVLPGAVAFRLHDTYGFPIDLTVELAAEYGVRTDLAGFQDALAEQRERSRSGTKADLARTNELISLYNGLLGRTAPTEFLGYETTSDDGRIVAILRDGTEYESLEAIAEVELRAEAGAHAEIVLDRTPFYAESGGQVADTGRLLGRGRQRPVRRRGRPARRRHPDRRAHRPPRHAPRRRARG